MVKRGALGAQRRELLCLSASGEQEEAWGRWEKHHRQTKYGGCRRRRTFPVAGRVATGGAGGEGRGGRGDGFLTLAAG